MPIEYFDANKNALQKGLYWFRDEIAFISKVGEHFYREPISEKGHSTIITSATSSHYSPLDSNDLDWLKSKLERIAIYQPKPETQEEVLQDLGAMDSVPLGTNCGRDPEYEKLLRSEEEDPRIQ
jgi:hypothetical protein